MNSRLDSLWELLRRLSNQVESIVGDTVEIDLGSTLANGGSFLISDTRIAEGSIVQVLQAPGPYTGKGSLADESEMAPITVVAVTPTTGAVRVLWSSVITRIVHEDALKSIGLARGNVKFSYHIL